ncbi:hypothetical protein [Billgrantia gudaonensis]|uniref:Uncharacterized protein n=1 Tax=Billgrantia gudaonensis TaxID=376427 RepID=A0A1G8Y696_9GAMM|nr:hypothetical protein [Halomonas gudaonensis]SDJ98358.1 hypothetical protein SAMN04487954_11016 [Halomonas gudaonensis]
MLRGAFTPSQITDFINREAFEHAGGRVQSLADEEGMVLRELSLAMTAPRSVAPYWRQLRDERFYRGQWADRPRGSRYVLVSGYEVGADRTLGVREDS